MAQVVSLEEAILKVQNGMTIMVIEIATPLCNAYPSDEGWWLIGEVIQSYGGYGYCEEYP